MRDGMLGQMKNIRPEQRLATAENQHGLQRRNLSMKARASSVLSSSGAGFAVAEARQ